MGKEIITFSDIDIERPEFYRYKSPIFSRMNSFFFEKQTLNTLLVNCVMIIKLSFYI